MPDLVMVTFLSLNLRNCKFIFPNYHVSLLYLILQPLDIVILCSSVQKVQHHLRRQVLCYLLAGPLCLHLPTSRLFEDGLEYRSVSLASGHGDLVQRRHARGLEPLVQKTNRICLVITHVLYDLKWATSVVKIRSTKRYKFEDKVFLGGSWRVKRRNSGELGSNEELIDHLLKSIFSYPYAQHNRQNKDTCRSSSVHTLLPVDTVVPD